MSADCPGCGRKIRLLQIFYRNPFGTPVRWHEFYNHRLPNSREYCRGSRTPYTAKGTFLSGGGSDSMKGEK